MPAGKLPFNNLKSQFVMSSWGGRRTLPYAFGEAIARLTEYRTALITATTIGKIDVRQVAIPAEGEQSQQAILPASLMEL